MCALLSSVSTRTDPLLSYRVSKVSKAVDLVLKAVDLSTTDETRVTSEDTCDERS